MNRNPLIIALDVESAEQARDIVRRIGDRATFYKVGLELYAAAGMEYVRELIAGGKEVFLDMKFYDIGETVRRAVAQVARSGVTFLTVHGSKAVMRAAVEGSGSSRLQLLAVTVLTSFDESDLGDMGYPCSTSELVDLRVRNARSVGIDGIVCSPLDVARVREISGADTVIIVPGVRSPGSSAGDQKRVATPADAIAAGADYLVIGRQLTRAADPVRELDNILSEISVSR
jgi:orotidine-5'-phosphate decarboxylase